MSDPYKTLGVSPDASDDQIKSAYRNLAKKYHPDNYIGSPLSDLADEKMKEINEAYDIIIRKRREQKKSGKNAHKNNSYSYNSRYPDIRSMLLNGEVDQAKQILERVPVSQRDAEWYFLEGTVLYKKGWLNDAYNHFMKAHNMDPGNQEYMEALERMIVQRQGYYGGYDRGSRGSPAGCCSVCDICTSLLCMDCCCECMGGDCIRCC